MPYQISKVKGGYKVQNMQTGKTYSHKPLTKSKAIKQRVAIVLSEAKKANQSPSIFF
jgi:hypothetical protein